MSAEYESLSTASSDNILASANSRELFRPKVTEGTKVSLSDIVENKSGLKFGSGAGSGTESLESKDSPDSTRRRFLNVPPLPGIAFSLIRKPESVLNSGNREFQPVHPVSGREVSATESSVIDISRMPDPYKDGNRQVERAEKTARSLEKPFGNRRPISNDSLLGSAYRHLNESPWKSGEHVDYVDKSMAGAASVSVILKEQGIDYARSGSTPNLVKSLLVNGWKLSPASQAEAGDLIFGGKTGQNWRGVRGASDMGIVGTNGSVFHSDAASGEWRLSKQGRVFPKGQYGDQVWVLKAPENLAAVSVASATDSDRFHMEIPAPTSSRESRGARDGRRAYEEMKRREADERKSESSQSSERENPNQYWKSYWSDYWKDYWRDYYSKRGDSAPERGGDHSDSTRDRAGRHGVSIFDRARSRVGDRVWENSRWSDVVDGGRLGSATSVSQILKSLGYDYATSPGVADLARQLLSAGWKPVSLNDLRPGDVLYGGKNADWQKGGGNAHMAVVGERGKVLHNNSATGKFTEENIADVYDKGTYGERIWALRPPADGPKSRPSSRAFDDGESRAHVPSDSKGRGIESIVRAAVNSVGKSMFLPMLPMSMGRLGCAASVSGVLKKAGFDYANSTLVYGLHKQLTQNGWQKFPISEARPGDVVIGIRRSSWKNGGGGSHIGIVGEGNTSFHNSSARRQWFKDKLSSWNSSRYRLGVYVLRPPSR